MHTRIALIKKYYTEHLNTWPIGSDVIRIVVDYVLDLYILDCKKKYLKFFKEHTLIYQYITGDEYEAWSYSFLPTRYLLKIFNPSWTGMVAFPIVYTPLISTHRQLTIRWMYCCLQVLLKDPEVIYIKNWSVLLGHEEIQGLPLVYYCIDNIQQKLFDTVYALKANAYE